MDTNGYDQVPRTSARSPVRYDGLNGDSALGEEIEKTAQRDTPAVIDHYPDTAPESITTEHTRPGQNHNANHSPQHLPPDRVPGLIHEREDTPELESFMDTRQPLKLSPSDIPPGTKKLYAVRHGHKPGIYFQWKEAQAQLEGYFHNRFQSFKQLDDALHYYNHTPAACTYQNGSCCQPDLRAAEQALSLIHI